jgi:hypothetical protein
MRNSAFAIIGVILLIAVSIWFFIILPNQTPEDTQKAIKPPVSIPGTSHKPLLGLVKECERSDGTWLKEYAECEHVSQDWCDEAGGRFKECASACRHDPAAEFCTMQCIPVCQLGEEKKLAEGEDALNATYYIDGTPFTLRGGRSTTAAATGSAKVITMLFGEPVLGDLDNDGDEDAAVILSHEPAGDSTFFYSAVAINEKTSFVGSEAILLGDRIAPQTKRVENGIYIVNYADRQEGEAMTVSPSIGVSKYLKYENGRLTEANWREDLIRIDNPYPGQVIKSPQLIMGKARGFWFFEGDFPLVLTDWDGKIIAESFATAEGSWMTEDFVRFRTNLEFTKPDTSVSKRGTLILQRDNPSGLPENDDALEITVYFE